MAAILSVMMIVTSLPADVFATGLTSPAADVSACEDVITYEDVSSCDDVSTDDVYVEESVSDNDTDSEGSGEELTEDVPDEAEDYLENSAPVKVNFSENVPTGEKGSYLITGITDDNYTTGEEIVIYKKIKALDMELNKCVVSYYLGEISLEKLFTATQLEIVESDKSDYTYKAVISKEAVTEAIQSGEEIHIQLSLAARFSNFVVSSNIDDVDFVRYTPAVIEAGTQLLQTEEKYTNTVGANLVISPSLYDKADLSTQFFFFLDYNSNVYELKELKYYKGDEGKEGTKLEYPIQNSYYVDETAKTEGTLSKSKPYYAIDVDYEGTIYIEATLEIKPIEDVDAYVEWQYTTTYPDILIAIDDDEPWVNSGVAVQRTLEKGATTFTITMISTNYRLIPKLHRLNSEGDVLETLEPDEIKWLDDDHDERAFIYKDLPAQKYAYKRITVSYENAPDLKLDVKINTRAAKELVLTDGNGIAITGAVDTETGDTIFTVPIGKRVFFTAKTYTGFNITKYTYKTAGSEKEVKPDKKGRIDLDIWEDGEIIVETKGEIVPLLKRSDDSVETLNNKAKVNASFYEKEAVLCIAERDAAEPVPLPIKSVSAKCGKKNVPGFVTKGDDGYILIDYTKAQGFTNSIKVTIKGDDFGTRELTFNVAQQITKFELKGVKDNKIEQTYGTEKVFDIVTNKNADLSVLAIVSGSEYCTIDTKTKKLTVRTYQIAGKYCYLPEAQIKLMFSDGIPKGDVWNYTITPKLPNFGTPTFKVVDTTDTYIDAVISSPKSLKGIKGVVYRWEANAVGTPVSPMEQVKKSDKPVYDGDKIRIKLSDALPGAGHAQKYDIKVSSYLVVDPYHNDKDIAGSTKEFTGISTKNPSFECKLSLDKKKITATRGVKCLLAKAVFTKDSTYREIAEVELVNSDGVVCAATYYVNGEEEMYLSDDGQSVYLEAKSDNVYPGKYTLKVYPPTPDGALSAPATATVTVLPAINDIKIEVAAYKGQYIDFDHQYKLYKQRGKAVSIKLTAKPIATIGDKSYKLGKTKLSWEIEADNEALLKAVSVKDGKVTVNKDYEVQDTDELNQFWVIVRANDRGDKSDWERFGPIIIKEKCPKPAELWIGDVKGSSERKPEGKYSNKLDGKRFKILDKNGLFIDFQDYSVSVSPKNGLSIDRKTRDVSVTKAGTYTVTVKSLDGKKTILSRKFVVKAAPGREDPDDAYDDTISSCFDMSEQEFKAEEIKLENNTGTANGLYLKVRSELYAEEEIAGSWSALCDSTTKITAKNAKIINTDKYYGRTGVHFDTNTKVMLLLPTKPDVEITIEHVINKKKVSNTYKIKVGYLERTITPTKSEYTVYKGAKASPITIDYKLKNIDYNSKYTLLYTQAEEFMSITDDHAYYDNCYLWDGLTTGGTKTFKQDANDSTKAVSVSHSGIKLDDFTHKVNGTGKITLYVCVAEVKSELGSTTAVALTKPAKITINVKDEPSVPMPTITFNSKVSLKKEAEVSISCKNGEITQAHLYGDVIKGQSNDLLKYVDFGTKFDGGLTIVLSRTTEPLPKGVKSLSGWISFTKKDLDGKNHTENKKITITFK